MSVYQRVGFACSCTLRDEIIKHHISSNCRMALCNSMHVSVKLTASKHLSTIFSGSYICLQEIANLRLGGLSRRATILIFLIFFSKQSKMNFGYLFKYFLAFLSLKSFVASDINFL